MRTIKLILVKKQYFITVLIFLCGVSRIDAQYNRAEYNHLISDLTKAKSDSQKIKIYLALGDYHVEQSYMDGYQKSMDTAFVFAEKSKLLSAIIQSKKYLADTYLLYSKAYNYGSNYDKSIEFAKKGIAIYIAINNNNGLFNANRALYLAYRYSRPFDTCWSLTRKNLFLARKTHDKLFIGMALEDCAMSLLSSKDKQKKSLIYFSEAVKYYKAAGKPDMQIIYSWMAGTYSYFFEDEKALQCIIQAIEMAEKVNDNSFYMIDLYKFAAITYSHMGRNDDAVKYLTSSYQISKKYIDRNSTLVAGLDLYEALLANNNKDRALLYLNEMENIYKQGTITLQSRALSRFILSYLAIKNYPAVEKYYQELIQVLPHVESLWAEDVKTQWLVSVALSNYNFHKKKYVLSLKYLQQFKNIVNVEDKKKMYSMYTMSFKIDSARGNYISAIKNHQLADSYKDSMFNEVKNKQLTELEVQYKVKKRNKDNLFLKQKAELQEIKLSKTTIEKNVSLVAIALLSLIIVLIYRQYISHQKRRKEITIKNVMLEKLVNEKEWLLKEIHHRVKNNLQIVMSLLNTQSSYLSDSAAITAINDSQHRMFSISLIHQKLYKADNLAAINISEYITELVEYLQDSFNLEYKIIFELDIEPLVMDVSQAVPIGLILNEAITNAIKYAFPNDGRGRITISLQYLHGDYFVLKISDNGIGLPSGFDISKVNSLGLKLIEGLTGDLDAKYNIVNHNGTTVEIEFCYHHKIFEAD